jgi:hypothetical protein
MRGAARTAAMTAAWAALHSLLAGYPAKDAAGRLLGPRTRNGLYRAGYNAVAVATFALLVAYVRRQPHRTLYHVRGRTAVLMRLAQVVSMLYALWGVLQVGLGGMSGLPNLVAWLAGRRHIPREPEGQTPPPRPATGSPAPTRGGPFALTRQALNFFLLPLLWLNPRMTTRLAAFNAVSAVYLYVGSIHSERRLRRAYGAAYEEAYRLRGVPFFLPRLWRTRAGVLAPRGRVVANQGAVR